ncbi:MAG: endolytic transglycosylase MltG [Candidatus Aenigmatarchaeota archaeon]
MAHETLIKKIFRIYPFLLLIFFLLFIILHFFYNTYQKVFIGERKNIYIYPKMKVWLLAHNLEKEGIITSSFYFRVLVKIRNSKIKAGFYEFNGFYNLFDVIKIMEKGGRGLKITITEGLTLKEVENIFKEKGFKVNPSKYKIKDFPNTGLGNYFEPDSNLEGFLAPDTYEFFPSDSEIDILGKILKNFSEKYLSEILKGSDFNLNFYERLILASIIEKEAKFPEDFPIIAGILIKRLKTNKPLEADATLVYEKCDFIFCKVTLTKEDFNKDSPYNTYKKLGLPPTPISNPGISAIKAVNNPTMTDYWYYLTASNGKAVFSKTLTEHKENIKKYLK